jgi:hypothetical protein
MLLFHATLHEFAPGQVVPATKDGTQYEAEVALLEASRPAHAPSRTRCVFATEKAVAAAAYLEGQGVPVGAIKRMYQVEMATSFRAPMRMVAELKLRLKEVRPTDAVVAEYWAPGHEWEFYEHFGPSFTVVGEVPWPSYRDVYGFGQRIYPEEVARSRRL